MLALYIVINFLVIWSIYLSSSFVHFKNGLEYLTRRTAYLWWDFCCRSWFQEVFLFVYGTPFSFSFSLLFFLSPLHCPLPKFPSTCKFSFLQTFWFFLDSIVLFLPLFLDFHFFIMCMPRLSMPNSIPISWQHILIVCISLQFFFVFGKQLDVVHVHKVINLFLWFCKFVALSRPPNHVTQWYRCCYK